MKSLLPIILLSFLTGCCAITETNYWYSCRPFKSEKVNCSDKVGDAKRACYKQVEALKKSIENQGKR